MAVANDLTVGRNRLFDRQLFGRRWNQYFDQWPNNWPIGKLIQKQARRSYVRLHGGTMYLRCTPKQVVNQPVKHQPGGQPPRTSQVVNPLAPAKWSTPSHQPSGKPPRTSQVVNPLAPAKWSAASHQPSTVSHHPSGQPSPTSQVVNRLAPAK